MGKGSFYLGTSFGKNIFNLFIIIVFTFSFGFAVSQFQNIEINTGDLDVDLLIRRIFYSPKCFAYEEGGRVFVGELDSEKLSSERLANCLPKNYALKVSFENSGQTFYNDEAKFNMSIGFRKFEKVNYFSNQQYVLIRNGEEKKFDILHFEVIEDF